MTYDMLHAPDLLVDDADSTVAMLVARIGLPEPDPSWWQEFHGHGYRAVFARVHRSRSFAPTRLEVIAPRPVPHPSDPTIPRAYVAQYGALQGDRPVKTHATVATTSDLAGLIERVRSRGIRHRVDPATPDLPHLRLWVGVSGAEPARYQPCDDAGLFFEVIPTQALHLRLGPGDQPPSRSPSPSPAEGAMVRVLAREYLVDDIAAALRTLSRNLDWEPAGPVEVDRADGCLRARMAVAMAHGATLELVQPTDPSSEAGRYVARWGGGPYYIRMSVAGLDAKADDLAARGTRFRHLVARGGRGARVRPDPAGLGGALFEFVEHVPPAEPPRAGRTRFDKG